MMLTAQPYAGRPARNSSSSIILPLLFQFFFFSIYFPISHIFYIFFHKSLFRDCNWVDSHASWASGSHLHTLQHHSGGTQLVPSSEPQVNALHLRLYDLAKEIIDLAQVLKGLFNHVERKAKKEADLTVKQGVAYHWLVFNNVFPISLV